MSSLLSLLLSSLSLNKRVIALLDLNVGLLLTIDDFVGFTSLLYHFFHFVTIQSFPDNNNNTL